jgi:1-acyl-sn-glycerol-3-phosphate acyltransferase
MNLVRSALFALAFYPWTAICVLLSFPASLLGTRPLRTCSHVWCRGHRVLARYLLGIRTRQEGAAPEGSVLAAVKHQSMYETLEIFLMLKEPAVVLKRELIDIPFWGWVVNRYGVIPIDRSGGAAALRRMMRAAEQAIGEGRPIVIFPEGTRVPPGETPPLQAGFAGLYRALKLPVVPVAVNSGRLSPRNAFVKKPGVVTMRFMPEVPPGLSRREVEAAVHEAINVLEPSV